MSENTARVISWLSQNSRAIPEHKLKDMYDELLNDIYEEVDICGYKYEPARTLRNVDPTAYRCGFVDWLSANDDITELGGEYWHVDDVEEAEEVIEAEDAEEEETEDVD
jgi:hypothetical protein